MKEEWKFEILILITNLRLITKQTKKLPFESGEPTTTTTTTTAATTKW